MKPFAIVWYDDDSTMYVLPERFETPRQAWDFVHKLYSQDEMQPIEYFVSCVLDGHLTVLPAERS